MVVERCSALLRPALRLAPVAAKTQLYAFAERRAIFRPRAETRRGHAILLGHLVRGAAIVFDAGEAVVIIARLDIAEHRPAAPHQPQGRIGAGRARSEEHTSELQSLMRISYAVFCLKKKQ